MLPWLLIAITAPYFLAANYVFQTVTFDQVTWIVSLYWVLCLITERRPRYWIYLGITSHGRWSRGFHLSPTSSNIAARAVATGLFHRNVVSLFFLLPPWLAVVIASALEFAAFVQITLPVTPPERLHASGLDSKNKVFADSVGWEEVAQQVARSYGDLPAPDRESTIIISAYCGVPRTLQIYGNPKLLPDVVSPQLSDYYWLPQNLAATHALMVDYLVASNNVVACRLASGRGSSRSGPTMRGDNAVGARRRNVAPPTCTRVRGCV